jgi:hypothetical protein
MFLMQQKIETMMKWVVPVSFVVVLPYWRDEPCHKWMILQTENDEVHHKVLPVGHKYVEGDQQENTKHSRMLHTADFQASLFLLQNTSARKKWPDSNGHKFSKIWHMFQHT